VATFYALIGYVLERAFSAQVPVVALPMVVDCIVFLGAGYLQWFVILPATWAALNAKQLRSNL
jgi:uncharacterized membrane protein